MQPLSDITSFQTTSASEQPHEKGGDVVIKGKGRGAVRSASTSSVGEGKDKEEGSKSPAPSAPYIPKNLHEFLVYFLQDESNLPVCTHYIIYLY